MPPYNPPKHTGPGRKPLSEEARKLSKMTVSQYREAVAAFFSQPVSELQAVARDPETPSLDVWIAMCILTAAKEGDYATLEQMLNRIIGKVKEVSSVEMTSTVVTRDENSELKGFSKDELRKLLELTTAKEQEAAAAGSDAVAG